MKTENTDTTDRFIQLRAQGATFAAIAAELSVSPRTLLRWSREHQHQVQNRPCAPPPPIYGCGLWLQIGTSNGSILLTG